MYQLLPLVVAAVSGVSASANVEKKVVKAMEGCQIVWEEKENCVTESNVEICRMKDTQQCEEVSKMVCQPIIPQEHYRRKREALVEKHKGTGKLLLPGDLRSIHQHFDLNGVDAKEPYYPPAKSLGSNLLPLLREDHRHQNLLSDAVISHPIPLVYQDEDDLSAPLQDIGAHTGLKLELNPCTLNCDWVTEECKPVVEEVCITVPKEACHKGTQEVCTIEKVAKEVCPRGRVDKFLGKIGHKIKQLLERWTK